MNNTIKVLDFIIYWTIILLPFSIGIAPAPMNVFMSLLIASFLAKKILEKQVFFVKSPVNIPLLLLFTITCISVFNSIDLKSSLRGGVLRLLQYIFLFFAIIASVKDKKHLIKIVFSVALGLLLVSLDSIWQVKVGHSFIRHDYLPVINIGLVRATSSFKDSNMLGIYLSGFAPLVFGIALYYFKNKNKVILLFVSLIILLGIALTYSRPALLAAYITLFFFGIARKDKAMIAILLIFTLLAPVLLPKNVKSWAKEVEYNPLRFMCNDDRIAVYRNSINMIKAHPLIGVGINAFMSSYKQYKEYPEYRNVITLDEMKAHNIYLQLAGEIGLAGLAIFLWLLVALFNEARDIYKSLKDNYFKIAAISLIGCLIAFLVNGLTESSLQYSRVALIFWYLCGLALSLKKFTHEDKKGFKG